jgi:hypothetical protein
MIAFDIDGCMNYIKEDIVRLGEGFFANYEVRFHPEEYYLRDIYAGAPQEAYDAFWEQLGYEIYTNPPREGAGQVIQYLKDRGIPACYITTRDVTRHFRGIAFDKLTDQWLKQYGLELPVHYRPDKDVAARELGVELMVEDKPANIRKLQQVTEVLIFQHPYNAAMEGHHVTDWQQVLDILRTRE